MNSQRRMFLSALSLTVCLVLIAGCGPQATAIPTATPSPTQPPTPTPSPAPVLIPIAQGYHSMAYDSESNKVVLVEVQSSTSIILKPKTWVFDPNTKTWQMHDGPPRGIGPLVYDAQSDRIIQFNEERDETWAYDTNTDSWTNMESTGGPSNYLGSRMAYDVESDRIILIYDSSKTWAYDYDSNTWTDLRPAGDAPKGWNFFSMSYDAEADRVIVWKYDDTADEIDQNKIGVYDYNSNTWEIRETEGPPTQCDYYNAMVYDPETGLNILFGGVSSDGEKPANETWGYDYATNTWKLLSASNAPSARGWHAMVYDSNAGMILIFGGGTSRSTFTNETWVYDPIKNEWSNITITP